MDQNPVRTEPAALTEDPFQRFFMSIVYAMVFLGIPGILVIVFRSLVYGIDLSSIIIWMLYPLFLVILYFHKRIPFRVFVWLFIGTIWILGTVGLIGWGILGSAEIAFMAMLIIVGISQDRGKVLFLTFVILLLYLVVGGLSVQGILKPKADPLVYATSLEGWIVTCVAFLILIGALADRTGWMFREIDISYSKIEAHNEHLVEEIKRREETQKTLEDMILRKEALLQNIHHRIKSNLQIISGIIGAQAGTSSNPDVRRITKTAEGRIRSMSAIHEILYQSEDLSHMNLRNLLKNLCQNIEKAFGLQEKNVVLSTALDDVVLGIENAVPFALILNEVINNSIIHGFPEGSSGGEIKVSLTIKDGSELQAEVRDNGTGIGNFSERRSSAGMGYDLINIISEEMGARYEVFDDGGTVFRIYFAI